jgi:uncharacterized coiled-coil DUF342 family protein
MVELAGLEGRLKDFKVYYVSLLKSLDEDNDTFKGRLGEAESTFEKMRAEVKQFSRSFEGVENEIAEYSRAAKRM